MWNCEANFLEYRININEEIINIFAQFTLLMRTGKYLGSNPQKQCLKDIEDKGTVKEKSEEMEKTVDCPLCLEPLEFDDKNFYPCTCGYQVCRFCWHRIRTNENGLCPACRRIYSENPANFQPLTPEELQKVKHQKKMKDIQKKQKIAENRKQLANIRVIQKNLVFAVGLPLELSQDTEKKEKVLNMFRQFGSTQKETITDRTSYAGSQGPSACVYITYQKPEDAVRAVKSLTNTKIDGRTIKVSLGTTKYCSNFLKSSQCPKAECLYLHELADEEASFTKEDIHLGKHLEYEQKLLDQTLNNASHSKILSPVTENNRTNQIRNADDCSESSDDLHQNNSFYDSSEASELSPSSNSQNVENMRNMGSDLNCEIENNQQNFHSANSDLKCTTENSPKQTFRSEETINVNSHSSNSNNQDVSFNPNFSNQILQKETETSQPPNFLNNHLYESALPCRAQSSSKKESSFLRSFINSSSFVDNSVKNSVPDVKDVNHKHEDKRSRVRDDDPDLGFDPCQESLKGLEALLISEAKEKARIQFNTLNRSPLSNNRSPTLSLNESFDVSSFRNLSSQSMKARDPPPGFTNSCTPNMHFKSPYETGSLNKTPLSLHNQMAIRSNYNYPRYPQPPVPSNNSFLPDFTSTLSREIPEIIPPALQQQQHNQQRLLNLSQVQYPLTEQRSSPLWNNPSQSQFRPMENLYFNQNVSENRISNDFNMRMPIRSNDLTMRQWQQQQLAGNMNNSPFQESRNVYIGPPPNKP